MTRINPKITARPTEMSSSVATLVRTEITMIRAWSMRVPYEPGAGERIGRPGLVDRFRPEVPTGPDRVGRVRDIRIVGTKASLPVSDPLLICGAAQLLEVRIRDRDPGRLVGRQHHLLIAEPEGR